MASALRFNKKRVFLLLVFINCCLILLGLYWSINNRIDGNYIPIWQFDLNPKPYAEINPCNSLDNCPDIRLKGNTTLRKSQLVLTRLLRVLDLICKKHNIQYFLYKGSILGAARHKGLNPFDADIDVALTESEYDKLLPVIQQELPSDVFFQTEETDPYYKKPKLSQMVAKLRDTRSCYKDYLIHCSDKCLQNGLQVDISVLQSDTNGNLYDLFSSSSLLYRFFRGPLRLKNSEIFPLKELQFEGFLVPIPNQWEKLLVFWYGDDFMTIPSPLHQRLFSGNDIDPVHSCNEVKRSHKS